MTQLLHKIDAELVLGIVILVVALAIGFSGTRLPPLAVVGTLAVSLLLLHYGIRPLFAKRRKRPAPSAAN